MARLEISDEMVGAFEFIRILSLPHPERREEFQGNFSKRGRDELFAWHEIL
jgi:hypothetical protein